MIATQTYGNFKHVNRAKQLLVFQGISSDGVEATDIDGIIEYKNKGYLIYEVKHEDAEVPLGQRLALERLINDAHRCGKTALCMVIEHEVSNPQVPVQMRDCTVRELYFGGERQWRKPKKSMTARQLTDVFIRGIECGMIK